MFNSLIAIVKLSIAYFKTKFGILMLVFATAIAIVWSGYFFITGSFNPFANSSRVVITEDDQIIVQAVDYQEESLARPEDPEPIEPIAEPEDSSEPTILGVWSVDIDNRCSGEGGSELSHLRLLLHPDIALLERTKTDGSGAQIIQEVEWKIEGPQLTLHYTASSPDNDEDQVIYEGTVEDGIIEGTVRWRDRFPEHYSCFTAIWEGPDVIWDDD